MTWYYIFEVNYAILFINNNPDIAGLLNSIVNTCVIHILLYPENFPKSNA